MSVPRYRARGSCRVALDGRRMHCAHPAANPSSSDYSYIRPGQSLGFVSLHVQVEGWLALMITELAFDVSAYPSQIAQPCRVRTNSDHWVRFLMVINCARARVLPDFQRETQRCEACGAPDSFSDRVNGFLSATSRTFANLMISYLATFGSSTSSGFLSSRNPRNTGCRSFSAAVHSSKAIWATRRGSR
jgi:hypothetical protein